LVEIEKINKKSTPFGKGGCHVTLPFRHLGRETEVSILMPEPFICKKCIETITREEGFSPEKDLCFYCYRERQAIKAGKCVQCGGPNPRETQWGRCDKCFNKEEGGGSK